MPPAPQQSTAAGSGYGSSSGSDIDAQGGASGSGASSFNLSHGAVIAIATVVALVVVFGVVSTVLFILAKRRQWKVRDSIRRASKRLTDRMRGTKTQDKASKRRGTIRMQSPTRSKSAVPEKSEQKKRAPETVELDTNGQKKVRPVMPPSYTGKPR